jgi:hypothetical protein
MEDRSGGLCSGKLKRRTCTRPRVLQETWVRQDSDSCSRLLALASPKEGPVPAPAKVAV